MNNFAPPEGHSQAHWKVIRERVVNKGEFYPEDYEGADSYQIYFLNQFKLIIRNQ